MLLWWQRSQGTPTQLPSTIGAANAVVPGTGLIAPSGE
jgi:hypothetical protein